MIYKFRLLILVACVLLFPHIVVAKECSSDTDCQVYVSESGNLMEKTGGSNSVIYKSIGSDSSAAIYVIRRSDQYYLVRESSTDDKDMIIVPFTVQDYGVSFDRVIYFSIAMMESTTEGHEVWRGQEYDFSKAKFISDFSWDKSRDWQREIRENAVNNKILKVQKGFHLANVTILDETTHSTSERVYVYPEKISLTPDSVSCYSNCKNYIVRFVRDYTGGIGRYPIQINFTSVGKAVSGYYHYKGKISSLYLSGTSFKDGKIYLKEFTDKDEKNQSGSIDANRVQPMLIGTWSSANKKIQLPFFAVPDEI